MTPEILFFFNEKPGALPIYQALEDRLLSELDGVTRKVQKTQITFSNRHGFAFVSFLPVRRAKQRPKDYITVSFGLGRRESSPRIDAVSEPCPGRWTHHVLVGAPEEIDDELAGWIKEAAAFSAAKR